MLPKEPAARATRVQVLRVGVLGGPVLVQLYGSPMRCLDASSAYVQSECLDSMPVLSVYIQCLCLPMITCT